MAASRRGGEVFYPPEEIGGEKNSPPLLPIARFEFTLRDFGAVAFCLLDSLPDLFSSKSLLVPINEEKAGNKAQWVNFLSAGPYEGNYKIHLRLYRLNADNDYVVTSRGSALNPDGERRKTMTPPHIRVAHCYSLSHTEFFLLCRGLEDLYWDAAAIDDEPEHAEFVRALVNQITERHPRLEMEKVNDVVKVYLQGPDPGNILAKMPALKAAKSENLLIRLYGDAVRDLVVARMISGLAMTLQESPLSPGKTDSGVQEDFEDSQEMELCAQDLPCSQSLLADEDKENGNGSPPEPEREALPPYAPKRAPLARKRLCFSGPDFSKPPSKIKMSHP